MTPGHRTHAATLWLLLIPLAAAGNVPGDPAEQVRELRVFLTRDSGVVRSEIALVKPDGRSELVLTLEPGPVRFTDDGRGADRRAGDGVYSASYRMDVAAEFRRLQSDLAASTDALLGDGTAWVTRAPRDTVRARDAVAELRRSGVSLDGLQERTTLLLQAPTAAAAAAALRVNIDSVPFMRIATGRFDRLAVTPFRLFDVPLFKFIPKPLPIPVDAAKSLMIRASAVVDDSARTYDACTGVGTPGSAWSFGHLMREMSQGTGVSPEDFVMSWLSTWQTTQVVNDWIIDDPVRSAALTSRVIAAWEANSGGALNVDEFPARLFAIVNRPDLADKVGYGKSGSGGEGRLVFGLYENSPMGCKSMNIMVIFEYGIAGGSCAAVKAWHQRWKDLDAHALGSAPYNALLEDITRDFTDAGSNPAQQPNQSSLNQVRVNEVGLHFPDPWQLREFHLLPAHDGVPDGLLGLAPVALTPRDSFNLSTTLDQYLAANAADILLDKHQVPLKFPTPADSFRGVTPEIHGTSTSTFWNGDVSMLANGAEVRRKFSLNTCNACHARETDTLFTHIGAGGFRGLGGQAAISEFLMGTVPWFTDPVTGQNIHYDDLEEREDRLSDILTASCTRLLASKKVSGSH